MNADEAIKRLAAAQGIDYLNLIKSVDERNAEQQQQMQQQQQAMMMQQAGQFANSPMADPTKNPQAADMLQQAMGQAQQQQQPAPEQQPVPA